MLIDGMQWEEALRLVSEASNLICLSGCTLICTCGTHSIVNLGHPVHNTPARIGPTAHTNLSRKLSSNQRKINGRKTYLSVVLTDV